MSIADGSGRPAIATPRKESASARCWSSVSALRPVTQPALSMQSLPSRMPTRLRRSEEWKGCAQRFRSFSIASVTRAASSPRHPARPLSLRASRNAMRLEGLRARSGLHGSRRRATRSIDWRYCERAPPHHEGQEGASSRMSEARCGGDSTQGPGCGFACPAYACLAMTIDAACARDGQ